MKTLLKLILCRTDPGDGMTAEGSSRVSTYLSHKLIHSYTLECNYNTGRIGNEVVSPEGDLGLSTVSPAYQSCEYTTNPEKYSPLSWGNVGQGCLIAMLDLRALNPCSRISKSKFRTLDRVRLLAVADVRQLSEYRGCVVPDNLRRDNLAAKLGNLPEDKKKAKMGSKGSVSGIHSNPTAAARARAAQSMWRRFCVPPSSEPNSQPLNSGRRRSSTSNQVESISTADTSLRVPKPPRVPISSQSSSSKSHVDKPSPRISKSNSKLNSDISTASKNTNQEEMSRSGPVTITPEKNGSNPAPRPARSRKVKSTISVSELKKQVNAKLDIAEKGDSHGSPTKEEQLSQMVATAQIGENSALSDILDCGTMHPPPRPLTLLLKGKSGSGLTNNTKNHSQAPTSDLLRKRHSRTKLRNSPRDVIFCNQDKEDASLSSGDLDARSEVYDPVVESKSSHMVYPLRASRIGMVDGPEGSTGYSGDSSCPPINQLTGTAMKADLGNNVSSSPTKENISTAREKATIHIAKLLGKELESPNVSCDSSGMG